MTFKMATSNQARLYADARQLYFCENEDSAV